MIFFLNSGSSLSISKYKGKLLRKHKYYHKNHVITYEFSEVIKAWTIDDHDARASHVCSRRVGNNGGICIQKRGSRIHFYLVSFECFCVITMCNRKIIPSAFRWCTFKVTISSQPDKICIHMKNVVFFSAKSFFFEILDR